jgi:hypothetical protein
VAKRDIPPWMTDELAEQLQRRIAAGWTFEKIEAMSTDEILAKLKRLGIPITPERFREEAARHDSAERMADGWRTRRRLRPEGPYDEDFPWMAAIVLWKRLVPDRVSFEQIDERMQKGYTRLEEGRSAEACDAWWQVWEWLREKVTPKRKTIEALDADFRGTQMVFNWCQDFEMELGNAGLDDPAYYRVRIRYCREFLETFDEIEPSIRDDFVVAEAESYWHLGEVKTAEGCFEALIATHPDWAWGYIDWSDLYWLYRNSPKDYARGEAILERALARPNLQEREAVLERLEELRAERETGSRRP